MGSLECGENDNEANLGAKVEKGRVEVADHSRKRRRVVKSRTRLVEDGPKRGAVSLRFDSGDPKLCLEVLYVSPRTEREVVI